MAHYRNMNIGERRIRYNIGKVYVELREGDHKRLIQKDAIGFKSKDRGDVVVTPKMIRDFLTTAVGSIEQYFPACEGRSEYCSDVKDLRIDPFEAEIYDRVVYRLMCDFCHEQSRMDV